MKALLACLTAVSALAISQPAVADCRCLANGTRFEHGQFACLMVPSGPFLARCDKVLNNSSWKKVQEGCPAASRGAPLMEESPTAPNSGEDADGGLAEHAAAVPL